nr:hypothetical protein GCM10025699_32330 [Microbacterium flavescens]
MVGPHAVPELLIAIATCSPVSIVVSGSATMSASIATAILAIVSGGVAGPAVFHVITRIAVSVFAGSASVPIPPRPARIAPLATAATPATTAIERANARIGRTIASSSASTAMTANATASSPRNDTI